MKQTILAILACAVIAASLSAQRQPEIDLSKYGITLTDEQKAAIIADLRAASPWIPADSFIELSIAPRLDIRDNTDRPFVDDPALLGTWTAIDFVDAIPTTFNPAVRQFPGELFWTSMTVEKNGAYKANIGGNAAWRQPWTKGFLMMNSMAQAYEIRTVKGKSYLFVEWKSGDYSIGGAKPFYYVFAKK